MDKKAQGAIEYLLIIGAAILIVAIVILAATGILSGGTDQSDEAKIAQEKAQGGLNCQANCTYVFPSGKVDCCGAAGKTAADGATNYCKINTAVTPQVCMKN